MAKTLVALVESGVDIPWRQLISALEKTTAPTRENSWATAVAIRMLIRDRQFMEHCGGRPDEVDKQLVEFANTFGLGVDDALKMIDRYPKKEDWVQFGPGRLRDKAAAEISRERATESQSAKRNKHPDMAPALFTPPSKIPGLPNIPSAYSKPHQAFAARPVTKDGDAIVQDIIVKLNGLRKHKHRSALLAKVQAMLFDMYTDEEMKAVQRACRERLSHKNATTA